MLYVYKKGSDSDSYNDNIVCFSSTVDLAAFLFNRFIIVSNQYKMFSN